MSKKVCNIITLDCSKASDVKRLRKYQKLERSQKGHFTKYLTLESDGCWNKKLYYFIAINYSDKKGEQLCGVAQTEIKDNTIIVNYLTSRAATDKSYRGTGTLILDKVVEFHKEDPRLFGIRLEGVPDAIKFYISYGFIYNENVEYNMFYPFDTYKNMIFNNKEMEKKYFELVLSREDKQTFDKLLKKLNINIKDIVETSPKVIDENNFRDILDQKKFVPITTFIINNYYEELDITDETFMQYIDYKMFNVVISLIEQDSKFIDLFEEEKIDISKLLSEITRRQTNNLLKALTKQNYTFTEDFLYSYIIDGKISQEGIQNIYDSGYTDVDPYILETFEDEIANLRARIKTINFAIDLFSVKKEDETENIESSTEEE
jgi:hypothetical protein